MLQRDHTTVRLPATQKLTLVPERSLNGAAKRRSRGPWASLAPVTFLINPRVAAGGHEVGRATASAVAGGRRIPTGRGEAGARRPVQQLVHRAQGLTLPATHPA